MAISRILSRVLHGMWSSLQTSAFSTQRRPTVGIIVIGDEVLKGQVQDTNSHFIAKNLTELGVKVEKISVIGDDLDVISKEVRFFSEQFTYVITTGGIGPTHDDVTYEGVAKAFGERTEPRPELVKVIEGLYHNKEVPPGVLKFAHVPTSAKLTYGFDEVRGRKGLFPNVSVRNVYIFPGVPDLMKRLFNSLYKELFGKGCKQIYKKNLYISEKEFAITELLNAVVSRFPKVTFGSYPKYFHSYYDVHITVESEDEEEMEAAFEALRTSLPKGSVVNYDLHPLQDAYTKVMQLAESNGCTNILNSMKLLEQCFQKCKLEEVCFYLDSSKESTAALHLLHAYARKSEADSLLRGFHVRRKRTSPEADLYIKETMWRYTVQCDVCDEPLESALTNMLEAKPLTKVIIFGRPSAGEEEFVPSAQSQVEWIDLLEGWSSTQVWDFVRSLYLPYLCR